MARRKRHGRCFAAVLLTIGAPAWERAKADDRPVTRVATIPIPSASIFIAVDGSAERLVGMHPLSRSAIEEGVLGRMFPNARVINSSIAAGGADGFMPNVETLAMLDPDVVVQWGDRGDDIVAPLRNAGMHTALMRYGTEQFARDSLTLMGEIAGKPDKARALIAWREAVATEIAAKAAAMPDKRRLKVVYLQRASTGLVVAGANTYSDYYIRLVGGVNAAAELSGALAINAEQLAQWDPDVILLNGFEEQLTPRRIYDDPLLSGAKAAMERRVYKMPIGGYRWDPPSHENPLAWMWLAQLLYPDLFRYDLRKEIEESYQIVYGYRPSLSDIDSVLRLSVNGDARGYDRFTAVTPTPGHAP
ncbi:ABC transporter substrate-binding protein [Methylocystis sp. JR02]|uniref:ABC transporter substrate-binding protein n=1 Tax=Methylocystis sp. JR02 TaxID=3046284 RepID=UPI0024BBDE46|nr:ABC transporter substrate-binding protein [Methylocystis sp. JR02]MDJ0450658.1 ABC transporter substrate-binding protein [Methylocystis sp. JR02]